MDHRDQICDEIKHLAEHEQPGALTVAEQAVDQHLALFTTRNDKLIALNALTLDLTRLEQSDQKLTAFLGKVRDYVSIVWKQT